MKINKLLLTAAIFASSLTVWSQSNSSDVIKNKYPQVYNSIANDAQKQWSGDAKIKNAVIEGQSAAFLDVLKSSKSVNSSLLRDAILSSSVQGAEASNTRILDEMPLNDALPLLQCDWYKVQVNLKKKEGTSTYQNSSERSVRANQEAQPAVVETQPRSTQQPVYVEKEPVQEPNYTTRQAASQLEREETNYPSNDREVTRTAETTRRPTRIEDSSSRRGNTTYPTQNNREARSQSNYNTSNQAPQRRSQYDRYASQRQADNERYFAAQNKDSQFNIGIRAGVGENVMYNLGNYTTTPLISYENTPILSNLQLKSVMGVTAEIGAAFSYKSKGFLVQNETGLKYMQATFKNKVYSNSGSVTESGNYNNKYFYLQTAFHIGGYFDVGEETQFVFGVGPYVGYQISATYDKYGIFGTKTTAGTAVRSGLYEDYMKAGEKKVNFGVSAMIGLDVNESRIALYPTLGLTKMQEKEDYKPFGVSVGYTYFFNK